MRAGGFLSKVSSPGPASGPLRPTTLSRPLLFTSPYSALLSPSFFCSLQYRQCGSGRRPFWGSPPTEPLEVSREERETDSHARFEGTSPYLLSSTFSSCLLSPLTPQGPARRRAGRVLHEEIRQVISGRDVRVWDVWFVGWKQVIALCGG